MLIRNGQKKREKVHFRVNIWEKGIKRGNVIESIELVGAGFM
jgi:hypothetical protein